MAARYFPSHTISFPWMLSTRWKSFGILLLTILLGTSACQEKPQRRKRISKAQRKRNLIDSLAHFTALPEAIKHPEDNPTSPQKVQLGKFLFFDPILSGNRDVACATCHHPSTGFAENLELSIGVNGHGFGLKRRFQQPNDIPFVKRNSPTIINTAFNGIDFLNKYDPNSAPMFWDSRAQSLEEQALEPLKALEEMRGHTYSEGEIIPEVLRRLTRIPTYRQLFKEAFGEENAIRSENLARALASYERTLLTNNSRFDQYMRGDSSAISLSEKAGFRQFIQSGCGSCHNGPMFSDYQEHILGVPDHPKLAELDKGIDSSFSFRTPSLRNLRFTSPYMHNGSLPTLKRVLEFYEDIAGGKMRNPNLTQDQLDPLIKEIDLKVSEMAPIISFLNTLNDNSFDKSEPKKVPSGLPVGGNIQ